MSLTTANISLAMIARDNEATIGAVLDDAAPLCREMIVVDTGSVDRTREIAQEHGARVFLYTWHDDFAAARNHAFSLCQGDWIIWLDTDDRLFRVEALATLCDQLNDMPYDVVCLPYRMGGGKTGSVNRQRIIRRSAGLSWQWRIHEDIPVPAGRGLLFTDAWVDHCGTPSLTRNLHFLLDLYEAGDRSHHTLWYFARDLQLSGDLIFSLAIWNEYAKVAAHDTSSWMPYWALLYQAECIEELAVGTGQEHRQRAVLLDPTRAEAWTELGRYHYSRNEWVQAMPYLYAATGATRPVEGVVHEPDYTYRPHDFLMLVCAEVGRPNDALAHARVALARGAEQERMQENIALLEAQIASPIRMGAGV